MYLPAPVPPPLLSGEAGELKLPSSLKVNILDYESLSFGAVPENGMNLPCCLLYHGRDVPDLSGCTTRVPGSIYGAALDCIPDLFPTCRDKLR